MVSSELKPNQISVFHTTQTAANAHHRLNRNMTPNHQIIPSYLPSNYVNTFSSIYGCTLCTLALCGLVSWPSVVRCNWTR